MRALRLWAFAFAALALLLGSAAPLAADEALAALTKNPRLVKRVEAIDPPSLAERGSVEVQLTLDLDDKGKILGIVVAKSGGADFDAAAEAAARQFQFEPGEAAGKPVPVRITYVFRFVKKVVPVEKPAAPTLPEAPAGTPMTAEPPAPAPAPGNLSAIDGEVLRKGDRTPVATAVVLLDGGESSTTTDGDGKFTFGNLAPGPHLLRVRGPGVSSFEITEILKPRTRLRATYFVVARVRYQSNVKGARVVRETVEQTLDVSEISRIPGTQGDVIKAVQNLPGVARAPFGGGQLVVWGSAPEDTRVYANGTYIPTLFHFGGLRATVNSEVVQNLTFAPGGYGADYGRGLGGLVEIEMRAPRTDGYHGMAQVDLIDGSFNVEGPITKKLSFGVSARRSWIDVFLPLFTPNNFQLAPRYWDYQLRLHWTPTTRDTVDFVGFGSDDTLDLIAKDPNPAASAALHTHIFYNRLLARWLHRFEDGSTLTLTPSTGYDLPIALHLQFGNIALAVDVTEIPYNLRAVYRRPLAKNLRLDAGLDFEGRLYNITSNTPASAGGGGGGGGGGLGGGFVQGSGSIYINGLAPWAGLLFSDDAKRLSLNVQARLESYLIAGSYQFPGYPDPAQQNARFDSSFFRPEIRLAVRYQFVPWFALKAAAGVYSQAPPVTALYGPLGNPHIAPQSAEHYVVGADFNPTPTLSISVEGFYKDLSNLIVRGERAGDPSFTNDGIGRVLGAEILVRQQLFKNFFGWASYTLSRAERKEHPDQDWHVFQYDQTHILTLIASYMFPRGYQVGLRFRYVTGNPYTPNVGSYVDLNAGGYVPIAGPLDSGRIGGFNQLDLRFDKTWTFNLWKLGLYLDIQNLYNAKNPEGYQSNFDYTKQQPFAGLPFLPSLGMRGDF